MAECNKGQYPYPDENVFMMAAVRVDVKPVDYSKTVPRFTASHYTQVPGP